MNIFINKKKLQFHLQNDNISYILSVLKNGHLGNLYFGAHIKNSDNFDYMLQHPTSPLPMAPNPMEGDNVFALDVIPLEYPNFGQGDYREPAMEILQSNGSTLTDFTYKSHKIIQGKPKLTGLPATYVENDQEAMTLEIILEDKVINSNLILSYTIYKDYNIIARNVKIINNSQENLYIKRLMSMSIDLEPNDYTMLQLSGMWGRERQIIERKISQGKVIIDSNRGASSAYQNPFIALKKGYADENMGEVYAFNLIYSGNFQGIVEENQFGTTRVVMGMNPFNFTWELEPSKELQSPEVVMTYSNQGLSHMSNTLNSLYKNRLARGKYRDLERPILLNNWEATYFNFNEEKILNIAKKGKDLGVELFVLDDGWFGARDDDKKGLGDWYANLEKLPSGISGLSQKIEDMGIKFGLWFEPEMVNKDSDLYRNHPDWIIQTPNRYDSPSRHQHVLDYSRDEVLNNIYNQISTILKESKISYIKWDMNRPMTEIMSSGLPASKQGEVTHRYFLGLYKLLDRLTTDFPDILFESCASGGSRFDGGMLYYMPQCWTSDNTDPVERLKIQHSTSMIYPLSAMGAHVSASPNHQTGRDTSLKMRADVACFGAFGYELDLNLLSPEEQQQIKKQIAFVKENRKLLQFGSFYRLRSPFKGEKTTWLTVDSQKNTAILANYTRLFDRKTKFDKVKLKGLDPHKNYKVEIINSTVESKIFNGGQLMNFGIAFSEEIITDINIMDNQKDFQSILIKLTAV